LICESIDHATLESFAAVNSNTCLCIGHAPLSPTEPQEASERRKEEGGGRREEGAGSRSREGVCNLWRGFTDRREVKDSETTQCMRHSVKLMCPESGVDLRIFRFVVLARLFTLAARLDRRADRDTARLF
jgi:hypothetical protein